MVPVEVYVCATHPVFSGPAIERIEKSPNWNGYRLYQPSWRQEDWQSCSVSVGPLIGDI